MNTVQIGVCALQAGDRLLFKDYKATVISNVTDQFGHTVMKYKIEGQESRFGTMTDIKGQVKVNKIIG